MTNFWNSEVIEASWRGLQDLSKEIKFVLIGGWAVYLYSRLQKSKDIDIILDYDALRDLGSRYPLNKNDRLKKYEIKMNLYDVDIYLPNYSILPIPPKDILSKYSTSIEGFCVPTAEVLTALKLGAALDRGKSAKGEKDAIDILGLLFYSGLSISNLKKVLLEYKLLPYMDVLLSTLVNFDRRNLNYLNLNENSFSKLKHRYMEEIKKSM